MRALAPAAGDGGQTSCRHVLTVCHSAEQLCRQVAHASLARSASGGRLGGRALGSVPHRVCCTSTAGHLGFHDVPGILTAHVQDILKQCAADADNSLAL